MSMRAYAFMAILYSILILQAAAMASAPFIPKGQNYNDLSIAYNYANTIMTSETLIAGASSYDILLGVETYSVVISQLNTASAIYVLSTVPTAGKITVNLSGTLTSDSNLSIIGKVK